MAKRGTPEINAGSMSDISFLLLTFFLLTSSVDVNKGMPRRLPPIPPEDQIIDKDKQVKERNILQVKVNSNDRLSVNRTPSDLIELKEKVKNFLTSDGTIENLPEVETKVIEGLGPQVVSKGVVSLVTDRGTSYRIYMAVQNEVMLAYSELRDDYAVAKFGKKFNLLPEDEQEAVKQKYPLNLSEAEPKDARKTK